MTNMDDTAGSDKRASAAGGRVPAPVRHQRIMDAFRRNGFISVTDMAQQIGVSTMTIRRDLVMLSREGKITRTHGGAVALPEGERTAIDVDEPQFDQRMVRQAEAKAAIAEAAAGLVGSRQSIALDVGTTILALARKIAGRADLRIFTNNMRAAMELAGDGSPVYILGGEVRTPEFSIVGQGAIRDVKAHFVDLAFIGVSGLGGEGVYDYSPEDTEVKRAFIENCGTVVVLCDASKFERRALARICGLEAIDILVTDSPPSPALAEALSEAGVRVLVAPELEPSRFHVL
ncbi:Glycerol-3-phosphate regulon repressor [Hartmannibacter diazotrophicus]|uniref:Glycerol-3-phosphate regulon repressor n=1 Tax=Hartmannibacter diazotrophicus TaxID=1482074 RepID=A0A2C9DD48_9HYPH|nr:DeoR/GlpR family DNA-binding transcription regulator [Hartmannibacter diazotrophicus]SON58038.1 Glycerol-3-phosphate regulon repressor [Hartmannibacter diazotrophicus]